MHLGLVKFICPLACIAGAYFLLSACNSPPIKHVHIQQPKEYGVPGFSTDKKIAEFSNGRFVDLEISEEKKTAIFGGDIVMGYSKCDSDEFIFCLTSPFPAFLSETNDPVLVTVNKTDEYLTQTYVLKSDLEIDCANKRRVTTVRDLNSDATTILIWSYEQGLTEITAVYGLNFENSEVPQLNIGSNLRLHSGSIFLPKSRCIN